MTENGGNRVAADPVRPAIGAKVFAGVCGAWVLAGVVMGAQTALGSTVSGKGTPVGLWPAIRGALMQTIPWIPVTLAVIALTIRFPLQRGRWKRNLPVHIVAAPLLAVVANMLVVLGYWILSGKFGGFVTLIKQGAVWATLRLQIALLIYTAILAITEAALYYRQTRARELHVARIEGQLAVARLQALNAQIRPHFLFNTMHTIGQMWRSGRSDDADAVLDHLGSLFHRVQTSASHLEVPLSEELDLVRQYLAIEKARFGDRLAPRVAATPEALTCMVPPLILQPIIENAVRHGISAVSSAGVVEVDASVDNGVLRLVVRDDGPGIGRATSKPGTGTGLRNTRERLMQLYGADARLETEDRPDRGTIVRIDIPRAGSAHIHV